MNLHLPRSSTIVLCLAVAAILHAQDAESLMKELGGAQDPADVRALSEKLGAMGPAARPAIPKLLPTLAHLGLLQFAGGQRAIAAIIGPGASGVATLTPYLSNANAEARMGAAFALSAYHGEGQAAVPVLAGLLRDKDAVIRARAVRCLGAIGYPARSAVPGIIAILENDAEDADARRAAASSLALIDWGQPDVIPALTRSMYVTTLETLDSLLRISNEARARNSTAVLPQLSSALDWMVTGRIDQNYGEEAAKALRLAIDHLRSLEERRRVPTATGVRGARLAGLALGAIVLVFVLAWFGLYAFRPLQLLRIVQSSEVLRPFENTARLRDARMTRLMRLTSGKDPEARRAAMAEMSHVGPEAKFSRALRAFFAGLFRSGRQEKASH